MAPNLSRVLAPTDCIVLWSYTPPFESVSEAVGARYCSNKIAVAVFPDSPSIVVAVHLWGIHDSTLAGKHRLILDKALRRLDPPRTYEQALTSGGGRVLFAPNGRVLGILERSESLGGRSVPEDVRQLVAEAIELSLKDEPILVG